MEDMNAYMYMVTSQLAYILQQGAAIEWDAETTYYTGSIVAAADGSGIWYRSLIDDNTRPLTDTTAWKQIELSKNGTPLFAQITTDYVLSGDDAIGWAMQGSQVSNSIYPDAYSRILNLYNLGTDVVYRGITAKRASDGRYIADISQLENVNNLFNNTGAADFYVIDILGQNFYLPKTARYIQYTTTTNNVNNFNDSGLPALNLNTSASTSTAGGHNHNRGNMQIWGNFQIISDHPYVGADGSFFVQNQGMSGNPIDTTPDGWADWRMTFEASRTWTGNTSWNGDHSHRITASTTSSNQVYGRQTYVQPPSSLKLLYYRVGNTAV
jgi:sulfur transfer complex TusBCD TusB component (DsrH family)